MDRRKLESAALFLTIAGALLIMPPLAVVFQVHRRFLGVPAEVIYLFLVWAALILGAWWLGRRLLPDAAKVQDSKSPEDDG
jgi:Kef-type K+ transport system membrane component KefB